MLGIPGQTSLARYAPGGAVPTRVTADSVVVDDLTDQSEGVGPFGGGPVACDEICVELRPATLIGAEPRSAAMRSVWNCAP